MGLFSSRKTVFVESDILVIGGGFGGCGAAYESRYWGRDLKVVVVELERVIVDNGVVLIERATGLVLDVLENVIKKKDIGGKGHRPGGSHHARQ